MKIIELINADGTRTLATKPVDDDFDVQAWINQRAKGLVLLGVIKVEETYLEEVNHEQAHPDRSR